MDHEVGPWKMVFYPLFNLMVQLLCSDFFKDISLQSLWSLSRFKLNVIQEEWPCTKVNVFIYFKIYAQKGSFEKSLSLIILLSSPSLSLKYIFHLDVLLQRDFFLMCPCLFLLEHFFCLFHYKTCWAMSLNNLGLEICLLGTSNSMVSLTFFFLGVNQSGSEKRSITNQNFYKTLGWLHGPWCKQPFRVCSHGSRVTWGQWYEIDLKSLGSRNG
jgi:hypothetical protein